MKERFTLIVILMSLSLAGIIFIQTLWVRHAIKLESSRFEKSVYEALRESVVNWQRFDRFSFINKKLDLPPPPPPPAARKSRENAARRERRVKTESVQNRINRRKIHLNDSSTRETIEYHFNYNTEWLPDESTETEIRVHTTDGKNTLVLSRNIDSLQVQVNRFHDSIEQEKARLIEEKLEQFNENMEEWVVEYNFDISEMLTNRPTKRLDTLLKTAFSAHGITIPFEYQILRQNADSTEIILPARSPGFENIEAYQIVLFPDSFFRNNIFLSVAFPDKNNFVFKSVLWLFTGSVLFTLIILSTFWLTIYYMVRQKKVSQIKTDFINNMTHEFKTPIATIGLAGDALLSPKVFCSAEPTKYYLEIIKQENKRMNIQVEKVLQAALIEKGNLHFEPEWVDAHQVIMHTTDKLQLTAQQKKGRITTVLRASCSFLLADEIHFTNLMNNLIDNALKYCDKEPEVVVETFNQQDNLVIRVADNGIGMSKEIMRHIFDQFYRKPTGNIHNVKGFGLGLNYVKAIVSSMNGSIQVTSEPDNGSIFILKFNCQRNE